MYDVSMEFCFYCFKQKTAYEMRISDWSSDVCSSDHMIRQDLVIVFVIFGMDHLRFPVAVNTPFHGQWRELIDLFHLSYRTVASIAYRFIGFQPLCLAARGFSHGNMLGMIKVGKIRSEERRVGKECVSRGRYRRSP